ncbi:hypothetical protein ADL03_06475 [Nocardia sp. NRRL S-836]|nr:hypothetical protein ADL03_06475 [Nocardia sp. NRRL S-836]
MLANAVIMQLVSPVVLLALPLGIGSVIVVLAGYRKLSQVVEQRAEVPELAKVRVWSQLRRGALLGSGLFVLLILLIGMFGGWQDMSWGSIWGCLGTAGLTASVAVTEEVLFRGVLFRIMEERTGTVVALIVSSLIFGLTHSINAEATLWGVLSIALTGGVLTTAAYVATRSLWLPIGLHFAWNCTHAGIFGVTLSGTTEAPHGLLQTTLSGPTVLTGGTFGPEASLIALLVCVVPAVVLLRRAARTGQIRRRADAGA